MIEAMQVTTTGRRPPTRLSLRAIAALAALAALPAVTGCVYRMPVLQGNHLERDTIVQVKPGMTRAQVRYLLGTPMVPGGFANDRWDYDFYLKTRRLQTPRRGHATVYFHDDLVDHVDSDVTGTFNEPLSKRPPGSPGG